MRPTPSTASPNFRRLPCGSGVGERREEREKIRGLISARYNMGPFKRLPPRPSFRITCENREYPSCGRISEIGEGSIGFGRGGESAPKTGALFTNTEGGGQGEA